MYVRNIILSNNISILHILRGVIIMKILLVNKFHYMKGGSERYYFTLADAFKESTLR